MKRKLSKADVTPIVDDFDYSKEHILVIDNGGDTIKAGFAGESAPRCVFPNLVAKNKKDGRSLLGEHYDKFCDKSNLHIKRPVERGYLVNQQLQYTIWTTLFAELKVNPSQYGLLLTLPPFTHTTILQALYDLVFNTFNMRCLYIATPARLVVFKWTSENTPSSCCNLVVDAGHSFTHIFPFYDQSLINYAIKRINVGGKVLTNYLKELVSYRHWNMMDETHVITVIKEKMCYVTLQLDKDMEAAKKKGRENTVTREFVLPDYITTNTGYVKEPQADNEKDRGARPADGGDEQVLPLANERFLVPEVLFSPSDVGITQAGVAEAVLQAVEACPPDIQPLMTSSIILVGGSACFPNFRERIHRDVRALIPQGSQVNVHLPEDPVTYAWQGGSWFAADPNFPRYVVSAAEYREHGPAVCHARFLS